MLFGWKLNNYKVIYLKNISYILFFLFNIIYCCEIRGEIIKVENEEIIINCSLSSVCNCIYSKLEVFKNYISKFLTNENSQLLEEYPVYYTALFDILGLFDEFKNEYHALIKTNRIIEYVFKHEKLNPNLKHYVKKVWKSFSTLLKFKLKMFENSKLSDEEYDKQYSKFTRELNKHRDYFYEKIYVQTYEFDHEINQIKNILF